MKRLLDLCSAQGGGAKGYKDVGFIVVGVDKDPQPLYYGDDFFVGDAVLILEHLLGGFNIGKYYLSSFDAIHVSPPCQRYSEQTRKIYRNNHPDLIAKFRKLLIESGKPYVIENVENARSLLINPIMLCGTMFGLNIWRHRYFECSFPVGLTPPCNHADYSEPVLITGTTRRKPERGGRFEYSAQQCRDESGLGWMTRKGMDQALLPVQTAFIGHYLMEALR